MSQTTGFTTCCLSLWWCRRCLWRESSSRSCCAKIYTRGHFIKRGSEFVVFHPNFEPPSPPPHFLRQFKGQMESGCPERREKREFEISGTQPPCESAPPRIWTNWSVLVPLLGRIIPDFEVLDSKYASASKKLLTADFKRRVYVEEQKAHQDSRFLQGRQIACMIYDNFKISGTGEALLDFFDLLRLQLKNDNVQGFDTKQDEVLLSMQEFPRKICWNFAQPQLQNSEELKFSWHCARRMRCREENWPVILDNSFNARNTDRSLQGAAAWKGNPQGNPKGNGKDTSKD